MSRLHPISGCENGARKADVIFLHGLGGDAFTTWRDGKDETTSWPHWLGKDFPQAGVWSLGYSELVRPRLAGFRLQHGLARPRRAGAGSDVAEGVGERPLLFICHSLGGLLAKQILGKSKDSGGGPKAQVAQRTRSVLFLATPHTGATLASLANLFRAVSGATVNIEDN